MMSDVIMGLLDLLALTAFFLGFNIVVNNKATKHKLIIRLLGAAFMVGSMFCIVSLKEMSIFEIYICLLLGAITPYLFKLDKRPFNQIEIGLTTLTIITCIGIFTNNPLTCFLAVFPYLLLKTKAEDNKAKETEDEKKESNTDEKVLAARNAKKKNKRK